jgi:hypothetical protein
LERITSSPYIRKKCAAEIRQSLDAFPQCPVFCK